MELPNLATHLPPLAIPLLNLATHLSPSNNIATHLPNVAIHLPDLATHLTQVVNKMFTLLHGIHCM